ncbi:hypothetical protein AUJ17_00005 [Candidatus Micrarchaeota archaeon CG1_02_47_40]|nr:MAG: hypothetical protein AUJ17_00005 [Candidatus Micrarchaeota archaeon CG1_02_47_40]
MDTKMLAQMNKSGIFYILIGICFVLFLFTKSPVFGVLVAIFIISLLLVEALAGAKEHGVKKEIWETFIALLAALAAWYAFSFLLGTSAPLNGIVTCSMLPNLERGDMVVLQGGEVKAETLQVSASDFERLKEPDTLVRYEGGSLEVNGSMFAYCTQKTENSALCGQFVQEPEKFSEERGAFSFSYKKCPVKLEGGQTGYTPCIDKIEYDGKSVAFDKRNDIIVYAPSAGELYSPNDIIHRAFVSIESEGKKYYITRGDNNVIADIQAYNYANGKFNLPPLHEQVKGKVLVRLPYVGYFKLFISVFQIGDLAFVEPQGCKSVLGS